MGGLDKSLPALLLPGPEHSREPAEPGCSGTWPCVAFTPLFSRTGFPPSLLPPQQKSPETIPVSRIMGKKSKSCSRRRIKTDSGEGSAEPKRRAGKLSPSLKLGHVTHSSAPSRGHPAAPGEHPLGDGMTPHSASPASGSAAWHCVSGTHRVLNALCGRHRYVPNLRQVSVAPRRHSCPSSDPPHGLRPPSRGTIPCVSAAPLPSCLLTGAPSCHVAQDTGEPDLLQPHTRDTWKEGQCVSPPDPQLSRERAESPPSTWSPGPLLRASPPSPLQSTPHSPESLLSPPGSCTGSVLLQECPLCL